MEEKNCKVCREENIILSIFLIEEMEEKEICITCKAKRKEEEVICYEESEDEFFDETWEPSGFIDQNMKN